ncbi:hypothetical protein BHE74_00026204 [Ensete ventricosum]|nr:hypothetical protein BHE74_00026204 [Ensete ventricosum]RZR83453.1 hypothetical protein BHM03_00010057 [Ensete ventricosum]
MPPFARATYLGLVRVARVGMSAHAYDALGSENDARVVVKIASNSPRSRTTAATLSNRASSATATVSTLLSLLPHRATEVVPFCETAATDRLLKLPHLSPALFSFEDMKIWVLLYTDVHIVVTTWSPLLFGADTPLHPRPLPLSPLPSPRARLLPPLVDHYRSPRRPQSQPSPSAHIRSYCFLSASSRQRTTSTTVPSAVRSIASATKPSSSVLSSLAIYDCRPSLPITDHQRSSRTPLPSLPCECVLVPQVASPYPRRRCCLVYAVPFCTSRRTGLAYALSQGHGLSWLEMPYWFDRGRLGTPRHRGQ